MRVDAPTRRFSRRDFVMVAVGVLVTALTFAAWTFMSRGAGDEESAEPQPAADTTKTSRDELTLTAEVLKAAGIEYASATESAQLERVMAAGTVQANELQIQDVTPLVSGRVERLAVVEGSTVKAGAVLLTMSSPEIAELQGALRAAEAKLAEAEATRTRTQRLVDLGAGAGKDLVAAEAGQRTAQAEVGQLRQRLQALGASPAADGASVAAVTSIRAPSNATVIERQVNPGQWIEAGTAVVKLANLSTVWVMASIPEARLSAIRVGAPVEIRVAALDNTVLTGKVAYVESELDPETRTAPVRVEVPNPGQRLRIGMFVDVVIEGRRTDATQLAIPATAVQRIGERTVVFVPLTEAGKFQVRDIEVGDELQGMRVVRTGLERGQRVVSKGGFTLKSQLLKGQFGEDEELGGKER